VARLKPELPHKFEEIADKALEKDRKLRYQSAADIRTDLQRLKRETESAAAVNCSAAGRWDRHWKIPETDCFRLCGAGCAYRRRLLLLLPTHCKNSATKTPSFSEISPIRLAMRYSTERFEKVFL